MQTKQNLMGYPSIDKPWLQYYSEEAINTPLPEMTLYQYIWQKNKGNLSDIALEYYGTKITYGRMFDEIENAAKAFYAMGVRQGDVVTIMSMHTPETIVSIYALNRIGALVNMIYMTLAEKEIVATLKNTDSKIFLVLDVILEQVTYIQDKTGVPVVVLSIAESMPLPARAVYSFKAKPKKHSFMRWLDFIQLRKKETVSQIFANHAAPAVIVYTSGTTGEPKGVVLSSDALNFVSAQLVRTDRDFHAGETVLHVLPIFFGFGIGMLHHGLCNSQHLVLGIAKGTEEIGKTFAKVRPHRFVAGPTVLDGIMKYTKKDLSRLKDFTGGGESISLDKEREFNQFLKDHQSPTQYFHGYGMTEFASVVALNIEKACKLGSVGIPLVYANVKVLDVDTHEELPYGKQGELCFCTPNIMLEYYKNPNATAKAIEVDDSGNRWMHTEDVGYVDTDGFIFVVGRLKRVYVTQDKDSAIVKIYPQRIEDVLASDPRVENCAVICQPDAVRIHIPIAFVSIKAGADEPEAELMNRLTVLAKENLPEYDIPAHIYILDALPTTSNGKVDYRALESLADKEG